jgi:hypothetical protein
MATLRHLDTAISIDIDIDIVEPAGQHTVAACRGQHSSDARRTLAALGLSLVLRTEWSLQRGPD